MFKKKEILELRKAFKNIFLSKKLTLKKRVDILIKKKPKERTINVLLKFLKKILIDPFVCQIRYGKTVFIFGEGELPRLILKKLKKPTSIIHNNF